VIDWFVFFDYSSLNLVTFFKQIEEYEMPTKYDDYREIILTKKLSDERIALEIGCTVKNVQAARFRFKHPERLRKWHKENHNRTISVYKKWIARHSKNKENKREPYHPWEEALILSNLSTTRIAKILHRSISAIYTKRKRLKRQQLAREMIYENN
jgi:hypothetical protein